MLLWPPLSDSQLSPVVPRCTVLQSGHTPGNRHNRRTNPGEGLRCCVRLHMRHEVCAAASNRWEEEYRSTSRCRKEEIASRAWADDWFEDNDADITNLLAENNGLHKAYMDLRTDATKAAFFRCRRLLQQRLREMQDAWMIRKAEEIQGYADRNEMKNFFKAMKAIYGPCIKGTAPLISSHTTTLLTKKSQILKRWAEHFRNVLNFSSAISDAVIDRLLNWTRTITWICHLPYQKPSGTFHDLLFPDDYALNTVMEEDMQRSMDLFATTVFT
ncbi:unnamed protein product [Schistocephalus solidus]|uniref:Uncharacterized protein n=1 Tax=Schistocephalus solidus TaxID=70667 RepID=A0A183SI66_SCHSO|nr:unnamed protein product [Schistocephalus solidus]